MQYFPILIKDVLIFSSSFLKSAGRFEPRQIMGYNYLGSRVEMTVIWKSSFS